MANRVVVTGMGAITPLGNTVETFWEGLKKGKAATGPITKYDTSNSKIKLACEVKDFDPLNYMDFKTMKRMEPFAQFAVAAAKEAIFELIPLKRYGQPEDIANAVNFL